MDPYDHLAQYNTLLGIRQKGRLRAARLSGAVFVICLLLTIGSGVLVDDLGRSLYLLLGLNTAFGLGFMMSWVRLEIINSTLELLDVGLPEAGGRASIYRQ